LKLNKENNITILISSHILGELSKIATRYGVINNGVMVDEFTKEELKTRHAEEIQEIVVDDTVKAFKIIKENLGISEDQIRVIDDKVIRIINKSDSAGNINTELAKNDITISSSTIIEQDLEDYFMKLMEQTV
jgi:ABC-2 type transport system ATP-binding protein